MRTLSPVRLLSVKERFVSTTMLTGPSRFVNTRLGFSSATMAAREKPTGVARPTARTPQTASGFRPGPIGRGLPLQAQIHMITRRPPPVKSPTGFSAESPRTRPRPPAKSATLPGGTPPPPEPDPPLFSRRQHNWHSFCTIRLRSAAAHRRR